MIYLFTIYDYPQAWLLTRGNKEGEVLKGFFYAIYDDIHTYVQVRLKAKMPLIEAMYIRQCCDLIAGMLEVEEEPKTFTDKHLERIFLFSLMWSLGAVLELDDRASMEQQILVHTSKLEWPKLLEEQSIFEYLVGDNGKWQHWSERVEEFLYPQDTVIEFANILVPNIDNVRSAYLMKLIAKQGKAVLFIGEQGTAKTVMVKSYLGQFDPDTQMSKSINFSSATSPNMFQVRFYFVVSKFSLLDFVAYFRELLNRMLTRELELLMDRQVVRK